jgi:tetratricopeptide (TPR) repeat protein
MSSRALGAGLLLAVVGLIASSPSLAQNRWSWPEKADSLKVLPKGTSKEQLRDTMHGFTRGLGVRCNYCHVGEEGQPLSTYDFVSDKNPNKDRAREMMRMMHDIHTHLEKIQPSGDQNVAISCYTCHRGRPRPMTLEQELTEAYRGKGLDAALSTYDQLHTDYYGRGAYDFDSEEALNVLGYTVLGKGDYEGAIKVFTMNAEKFPKSGNVWDSLAEAYMKSGDMKSAEQYYENSLELEPRNRNAAEMLKKIRGGGGD